MLTINEVTLLGYLGANPEIKTTQKGAEIATLSLATEQRWNDEAGTWQTRTDWHKVTIFHETLVKWIKSTLRKGDPLLLEGRLAYGDWEDKRGSKHHTAHVVIAGGKGKIILLRSEKHPLPTEGNTPNEDNTDGGTPDERNASDEGSSLAGGGDWATGAHSPETGETGGSPEHLHQEEDTHQEPQPSV